MALTTIRLAIAALTPLSADEAYYRIWALAPATGYLDHPPMVALWIRAGMALGGDTAFGIRLLAPLAALAGTLLLADAAHRLAGPPAARAATWLLNGTLLLAAGSVIITPDTPLLFFWTAALWALVRLTTSNNPNWWLAAGAAAGLALTSKYTAALLAPALLIWLALPAQHRWWRTWQLYAAAALALALFTPVIAWNAAHHWASFAKQGGRAADFAPLHAARALAELAAGQIGLATPLIAAAAAAGLTRLRHHWREPAPALLLCLALIPTALFTIHALGGDRVQANWPAPAYPAALLAAALTVKHWRPAAWLGLALAIPIYAQAAFAPLTLPRRLDFTLIRLAGWSDLAAAAEAAAKAQHATYIAADEYTLAAELAFHSKTLPIIATEPRWTLFALPPAHLANQHGLLIHSLRRPPLPLPPITVFSRQRHGVVAETYAFYRLETPPPGPVPLP